MAKQNHEKLNGINQPEIDNLSIKVLEKCNEVNVSVPAFAEMIGLGYMTIRRIVHRDPAYTPNIKILYPIADFFECTIPQLLSEHYIIKIPYFNSIAEFVNTENPKLSKVLVSKTTYLHSKYNKFVKIKYYNDLESVFCLTSNLPDIVDPFGSIISIDDRICFGYLTIKKRVSSFHDFSLMKKTDIETEKIVLIGIKEPEIDYSADSFPGYLSEGQLDK